MSDDKFECPGCGERANAQSGDYCTTCEAFVCNGCQKRVETEDGAIVMVCPVCQENL